MGLLDVKAERCDRRIKIKGHPLGGADLDP